MRLWQCQCSVLIHRRNSLTHQGRGSSASRRGRAGAGNLGEGAGLTRMTAISPGRTSPSCSRASRSIYSGVLRSRISSRSCAFCSRNSSRSRARWAAPRRNWYPSQYALPNARMSTAQAAIATAGPTQRCTRRRDALGGSSRRRIATCGMTVATTRGAKTCRPMGVSRFAAGRRTPAARLRSVPAARAVLRPAGALPRGTRSIPHTVRCRGAPLRYAATGCISRRAPPGTARRS